MTDNEKIRSTLSKKVKKQKILFIQHIINIQFICIL